MRHFGWERTVRLETCFLALSDTTRALLSTTDMTILLLVGFLRDHIPALHCCDQGRCFPGEREARSHQTTGLHIPQVSRPQPIYRKSLARRPNIAACGGSRRDGRRARRWGIF